MNGKVTINNRIYLIYWSGEIAQHVSENYINDRVNHPVLHVAIQQMLVRSEIVKHKNRSYVGFYQHQYGEGRQSFQKAKGGTYLIYFLIDNKTKTANLKTCYYMPMSKVNAKQKRGLSGTGQVQFQYEKLEDYPKQIRWNKNVLKKMVAEGLHQSEEEAKRFILEGINR